jgi:hypothetical protein
MQEVECRNSIGAVFRQGPTLGYRLAVGQAGGIHGFRRIYTNRGMHLTLVAVVGGVRRRPVRTTCRRRRGKGAKLRGRLQGRGSNGVLP